jgi:hypothetical protein
MSRHLRSASLAGFLAGLSALAAAIAWTVPASASSRVPQHTWWVQAGAPAAGTGTAQHPFSSLAQVQAASGPGDRILVLPAPSADGPLDGGIALQPDQQLIGLGKRVTGLPAGSAAPAIANTTANDNGDAITLATGDLVRNIAVTSAQRGGIYGDNVSGVSLLGNDITGTNTSCQTGFLIYFPLTLLPAGLPNGWAAILLDESQGATTGAIAGNRVHDEACADGIDVRATGTARVAVTIDGNDLTRLQQGPLVGSVLAAGFQTRDTASLTASMTGNSETSIGSAGADCEGIFTNQTGSSRLELNIRRNTFAHGIGGASCNGLEAFVGRDAASESVSIQDSRFTDDPGDMIEENNLGTGSHMSLTLNHVTVSHTTISNPEVTTPNPAFGQLTGHGDCINQFTTGAQAASALAVTGSSLTDCGNDGIFAFANTPPAAPAASVRLNVTKTAITGAGNQGVHWVNYAALGDLFVSMNDDLLAHNANGDARFDAATGAATQTADIDLGSSPWTGRNSFLSRPVSVESTGYPVLARFDWWGQPGGPVLGQVSSSADGTVQVTPPLAAPPR